MSSCLLTVVLLLSGLAFTLWEIRRRKRQHPAPDRAEDSLAAAEEPNETVLPPEEPASNRPQPCSVMTRILRLGALLLVLAALGMGIRAQLLVHWKPPPTLEGLIYLGSMIGAAVLLVLMDRVYPREKNRRTLEIRAVDAHSGGWRDTTWPAVALFGGAVVTSGINCYLLLAEKGFWATVPLWITSMAWFFLATLMQRPSPHPAKPPPWVASPPKLHLVLLGFILILGLAVRAWHLDLLPYRVHHDFHLYAKESLVKIVQGKNPHLFTLGYGTIPLPGHLLSAGSIALFGQNLWGMAMVGVITGVASILILYFLLRELWGSRAGLIGAFFLAVSHFHVHFSRGPFYVEIMPFVLIAVWLALKGVRSGRWWTFVAGGLCAGFGALGYFGGRLIPLLITGTVLIYVIYARAPRNRIWTGLVLSGLAAIITFAPMVPYYLKHPSALTTREGQVFELLYDRRGRPLYEHEHNPTCHNHTDMVLKQLERAFAAPFYQVDRAGQFRHGPMLAGVLAVLFAAGAFYALLRWRTGACAVLLFNYLLYTMIGLFPTKLNPSYCRVVPLAGFLAGMAALFGDRLFELFQTGLGRIGRWLGAVVMAGLLSWGGYISLHYYFIIYARLPLILQDRYMNQQDSNVWAIARFIGRQQPTYRRIVLVCSPNQHYTFLKETALWTAPKTEVFPVLVGQPVPLLKLTDQPVMFVLTYARQSQLPRLKKMYPNGNTHVCYDRSNGVHFTAYMVSAEELERVAASNRELKAGARG